MNKFNTKSVFREARTNSSANLIISLTTKNSFDKELSVGQNGLASSTMFTPLAIAMRPIVLTPLGRLTRPPMYVPDL